MALTPRRETVYIRDAGVIFKNLKGAQQKYNKEGDRNFSVMLAEDVAMELLAQGYNVKKLKQRDDEEEQFYHLKIAVSFSNKPPRVYMITNGGQSRNMLGEGMVGMFDDLDFTKIDLSFVPYDWNVNGNSGRKAYLHSMFGWLFEDELELEYSSIPIGTTSGGDAPPQPLELEPGARMAYDYEGELVEE